jgi:hypothetical protein
VTDFCANVGCENRAEGTERCAECREASTLQVGTTDENKEERE